MKYPIGIQNFESLISDGYVYVDKTALIYKLASEGRYYFLSRPRRFGKSLLISTLEAFFQGKRELFKGLAVEKMDWDWAAYPILHMDFNTASYQTVDDLREVLNDYVSKWEEQYGSRPSEVTLPLRFKGIVERAALQAGRRVVILVDEYDKPLLQTMGNEALQDALRDELKAFYSVLKTQDKYICLGFLTGVTKFSKVSVFSDLNNITDISLDPRYQALCGITEEELYAYFDEPLHELAESNGISYDEACQQMRKRYDGYHFCRRGKGMYNPFSLLSTLASGMFGSYWFETGTPTFLVSLLKQDHYRLPDLDGAMVSGIELKSVDSVTANPLPIIYQSGYLTIKDYDQRFDMYTLGFPNDEVEEGFTQFLLPYYTNITEDKARSPFFIANFIKDLEAGHPHDFMKRMEAFFADTDYKVIGDSELYFQNIFFLLTKLLGFYTTVEKDTTDGRIDMVIETKAFVYIIEFKMDKTAAEALQQINDKHYAASYAADPRQLYKIGVNFSTDRRCIDGWEVE